jgi:hypothetical protein
MAAITYSAPRLLDLGRVVSGTVRELQRRWLVFLLPSLLLWGGGVWLASYADTTLRLQTGMLGRLLISPVATILIEIVPSTLLYAVLTSITLADLETRPTELVGALAGAAKALIPLLAIRVITELGVLLGFVMLVIPGIWISLALSVAVPACVAEGLGVRDSLRRSLALTRGHRVRILWLGVIYAVAVGLVTGACILAYDLWHSTRMVFRVSQLPFLIRASIQAALIPIAIVGKAVIFHELRRMREGVGSGSLASVFD